MYLKILLHCLEVKPLLSAQKQRARRKYVVSEFDKIEPL